MNALVRSVVPLMLVFFPYHRAIEIPLNDKDLESAGRIEVHSKEGWRQVFITRSNNAIKLVCLNLKETVNISCPGNETSLSDCQKSSNENSSHVLCSLSLNLTGSLIFAILNGVILICFFAIIIKTCCRISTRHRKQDRKISYGERISEVITNSSIVFSFKDQHEPSQSTSPLPLLSFSCESENDQPNEAEPQKQFESVGVQTENMCMDADFLKMEGADRGDVLKYRSSNGKRYMTLKRGSQYRVHFYSKLTKNMRDPTIVDYARWNTSRDSIASFDYQFIADSNKDQNRKSAGQDDQTIDLDDDFGQLYIKLEDPEKDQPLYLVILPEEKQGDQDYLNPASGSVPHKETSDVYNPELPPAPTPLDGEMSGRNNPSIPPAAINSEHDGTEPTNWIDKLPVPQSILGSVDERLMPNDDDVYDALELDYNIPNQFRKYNNNNNCKDEKPHLQSQGDLIDSKSSPRVIRKHGKELASHEEKGTEGQSSDDEEHNYENIEAEKDLNENQLIHRQSSTYEFVGDLKNPNYDDDVQFAVVARLPISTEYC